MSYETPRIPGADPSGAIDSTSAVQAFLNAIPARASVAISGTYLIAATLTLASDYVTISGPAKFVAKANTAFEYILTGTGRTGVKLERLEFDANKANRTSGQSTRLMGAGFFSSTDCGFDHCTARNTRGYNGISAVGLVSSAGTRCYADYPTVVDCGDGGNSPATDSDGVFTSGDQTRIQGGQATRCTDTGFVVESSNGSSISDCTADACVSAAAISNGGGGTCVGNSINGLVVTNWTKANTGCVFVGALGAGDLLDTTIAGVVVHATGVVGNGEGPTIGVFDLGAGATRRCTIDAPRIYGATTQGIIVDAEQVDIVDPYIEGAGASCIQFASGTGHTVRDGELVGGTFGVTTQNAATATVRGTSCRSQTDTALYAFDTSTLTGRDVRITSPSVAYFGHDAGATIDVSRDARSAKGAQFSEGTAEEEITLNTGGTTTDSSANLLPAGAIIDAVTARVTTLITTAANWQVGDATTANRFIGATASLTAGSTAVGPSGSVQAAAAKVRITMNAIPGAGKIRITVLFRSFNAATS